VLFWAAPGVQLDLLGFLHETLKPQRLCQALEDMVEEKVMARAMASALEERLFG
jgi:hypothetical protein